MRLTALVGMATKFVEAGLGLKYREIAPETGEVSGGVMSYIEKGLGPKWKPLAIIYGLLAGIAAFGIGCTVQAINTSTRQGMWDIWKIRKAPACQRPGTGRRLI